MTDDELLDSLARMWTEVDPVPPGLVDDVLAGLAAATGDDDVELFELLGAVDTPADLRAGEPVPALRFSRYGLEMLVRVTADGDRRRLDGWLAPGGPGTAVLRGAGAELSAPIGPTGRFEFPDALAGPAVLEVRLPADAGRSRRVVTPSFVV
ncbi:hypothetical protein SAMN05660199_00402 [Klenkia soli]|uniref:Uncharacterized protein n=1 Tax=Klenkia soli TaxID=1052260 RepID=A0A1H0CTM2_9ACTN|nr:hypothetical protein [Klenkia soli]SDN61031.1 hypothetical protein SAMN05660199_00402 [Klenkia soli]